MSQTIPWLNYGTSRVTLLHGWKERDRVKEGEGALFPKFAPPRQRLFDIHSSTGGTLVGEPEKIYSV